jgi:glutaredoxin
MEWFIETRFGDPVLSIDISPEMLVYGSALGQVGCLNFLTKEQFLLTEMAEESIKGIHISEENLIYASVGDLYVMVLIRDENKDWHMEGVCHQGREHTNLLCGFTQILQHKTKVCLLVIEEDRDTLNSIRAEGKTKLVITNSATGEHEEYLNQIFPRYSVPFYFNSEKLLWMERDLNGQRILKILTFNPISMKIVKYLNKSFGSVTLPFIVQESIIFVHNFNTIQCIDIQTGEITSTIGQQKSEIVAIFPCMVCVQQNSERIGQESNLLVVKFLVISVDKVGKIFIWKEGVLMEEIDLCKLDGISVDSCDRYFGMGYPYVLKASGSILAVSTDIGILVIKSEYLHSIGGIDPLNNYTNTL